MCQNDNSPILDPEVGPGLFPTHKAGDPGGVKWCLMCHDVPWHYHMPVALVGFTVWNTVYAYGVWLDPSRLRFFEANCSRLPCQNLHLFDPPLTAGCGIRGVRLPGHFHQFWGLDRKAEIRLDSGVTGLSLTTMRCIGSAIPAYSTHIDTSWYILKPIDTHRI